MSESETKRLNIWKNEWNGIQNVLVIIYYHANAISH